MSLHNPTKTADKYATLILGTAGHIDHGKTALVRALTHIDTDRLPEERRRGMTIDLGFARLQLGQICFGIVDVPGHERFIRNMVAGAAGNDLAMLVVAADDAVMPQTREHLDILRWLGLRTGVVAITKCDLADEPLLELVEEEVRQLVQGTFLERAPVVRTSATTGEGIDALKTALVDVANTAPRTDTGTLFRMPIDRSFALSGHGTVVTGTIVSGTIHTGDEIAWLPEGRVVRVRSLESHGVAADVLHHGQRAAVGVAAVHHRQMVRGHELATPGWLRATRVLTAHVVTSEHSPLSVRHRATVRLHLGTSEHVAIVSLLEGRSIAAGEAGIVQLFLREPVTANCGQMFVLRNVSPVVTLGGGRILQPAPRRISRGRFHAYQWLPDLLSAEPVNRVEAAIRAYRFPTWQDLDLCRDAAVDPATAQACRDQLVARQRVIPLTSGSGPLGWLHRDRAASLEVDLLAAVRRHHEAHPLTPGMPSAELAGSTGKDGPSDLTTAMVERMIKRGTLEVHGNMLALPGFSPRLNETDQHAFDTILKRIVAGGFAPPTMIQLQDDPAITRSGTDVTTLLRLAATRSLLVHLGQGIYLGAEVEASLRRQIAGALEVREAGMTVSEIRQLLNTTRRVAIPLCEYLDRIGFTRRHGDRRTLVESPSDMDSIHAKVDEPDA